MFACALLVFLKAIMYVILFISGTKKVSKFRDEKMATQRKDDAKHKVRTIFFLFVLLCLLLSCPNRNNLQKKSVPTKAEIKRSQQLLEKGNELIGLDRVDEAILKYTKAIKLHNQEPLYFCNRFVESFL